MQGWIGLISVLATGLVVWAIWSAFDRGGRFWRLVAKHPDLALALFKGDPSCVVDQAPQDPANYAGPFSFADKAGRKHDVYMLAANIDETRARFFNVIAITVATERVKSKNAAK